MAKLLLLMTLALGQIQLDSEKDLQRLFEAGEGKPRLVLFVSPT